MATTTSKPAPPLRISLMGGFSVIRGGELVSSSAWQYRNAARTLVKLLALAPNMRLHREQVCDVLWPDGEPESAAAGLRKALHAARRALEPDLEARAPSAYLAFNGQLLTLDDSTVSTDVQEFREMASAALRDGGSEKLRQSSLLYGGDILPEDRYEDWAEGPRRELAGLYAEVLFRLVSLARSAGDFASAMEHVRALITLDPTDEEAHRELMRLSVRMGSPHAALLAYRECRRVLEEELGVEPSAETEALHRELLSGVVPREVEPTGGVYGGPPPVSQPLIGRDEVMDRVRDELATAQKGVGSMLLLSGEPGVGKTRLALEIASEAAAGGSVLWGSAFAEESLLPYSAFGNLLNSYLVSLSADGRRAFAGDYPELLPLFHLETTTVEEPGREGGQQEEARIFRGVSRLLSDLALQHPLTLIVDDLHLADAASLQLLRHLARLAPRYPWLIVGASRIEGGDVDGEFTNFVRRAVRDGLVEQIELTGLDTDACRRLAASLLPTSLRESESNRMVDRIREWSLGNPLFIQELAKVASERGDVLLSEGDPALLPASVQDLIQERVTRLSQECRRVLGLAAAAGLQWPFQLIKAAAGEGLDPPISEARLVDVFDEALAAGMIDEVSAGESWGYGFHHPLVQAVMYSGLSRARRLHVHGLLGRMVERLTPDEVELLAHHFSRSDDDDQAIRYLRAAADRALALYANQSAAAYFEELAARLDRSGRPREANQARLDLGRTLLRFARFDDAVRVLESVASAYEAAGNLLEHARAVCLIAQSEGEQGRPRDGMQRLQPLLSSVEALAPREDLVELYFTLGNLAFFGGEYQQSLEWTGRLREQAEGLKDPRLRTLHLGRAESLLGTVRQMLGEPHAAFEVLDRAVELAEQVGDLETLSRALNNLGAGNADAGNFPKAVGYLERALDVARRAGDPTKIAWEMCVLANVLNLLGRWGESEQLLEEALELLMGLEQSWFTAYPMVQLAMLHIARGDGDQGMALLDRAMPLVDLSGDLQIRRWASGRLAEADLLQDDHAGAEARIRPVLDRPGLQESDVTNVLPLLAQALVPTNRDEAREVAASAIERARKQGDAVSLVDAINVRGLVALEDGDVEAAEGYFAELLEMALTMSYPFAEGQARIGLAQVALLRGQLTSDAEEHLRLAWDIFRRLGARPRLEQIETIRAGQGPPARERVDSLTDS